MVTIEGKTDGYDLVLSVPSLKGTGADLGRLGNFIGVTAMLSTVGQLVAIATNSRALSIACLVVFAVSAVLGLCVSLRRRKVQRQVEAVQSRVAVALVRECGVVPKGKISLSAKNTGFTVAGADGTESLWSLTRLDGEGRIGMRSNLS